MSDVNWSAYHITLNFYAVPYFMVGFFTTMLGIAGLFYERRLRVKLPFLCLCLSASLWLVSYGLLFSSDAKDSSFHILLSKMAHVGVSLIPGFMLLFVSTVFQSPRWFKAWVYFCIGIAVFFCLVNLWSDAWFSQMYQYPWGPYPQYKMFANAFVIFLFLSLISGIATLVYGCLTAPSQRAKKRLRLFAIAFSISLFASMDYLPNYGFSIYPYGCFIILVFVMMVFETMRRYHLSDLSPAFAAETILETMQGLVLVLDMDGIVCVANSFACKTLGYKQEELIGRPGTDVIKFKDIREFSDDAPLANFLEKNSVNSIQGYTMHWLKKNGEEIELSVSTSILSSQKNSNADGVVCAAIDLTESNKTKSELHTMQGRFKLITESTRDFSFIILDPDGNVQSWNIGAERMKGYTPDEIIGKHFSCFYLPKEIRAGAPDKTLSMAVEHGTFEMEGWRVRKNGSKFFANIKVTTLKDSNDDIQGFLKITQDKTEQKKLEEQNYRNRRKMQEADEVLQKKREIEMKSNFISMVSHEIRTPLTSIKMSVDILKDGEAGALNKDQAGWIEMCHRNISRLTRLIDRVLDFQKLESGRWKYEFSNFDINEIVRELEKETQLLLKEKDIRFKMILYPEPLMVKVDHDKITEVLINLFNNAAKFTSKGSISVRTDKKGSKVLLSVADTGIGIPREDISKLFSSFTQIHGPAHRTGGTGLGLAISRKIIIHHEGKIWAESQDQKGATFFIELPISESE